MKHPTVTNRDKYSIEQDILHLSLLLTHVKDRLKILSPGINCTHEQHGELVKEKIDLTLAVTKAKLRLRGYTFAEDSYALYTYADTIIMLRDAYWKRGRA